MEGGSLQGRNEEGKRIEDIREGGREEMMERGSEGEGREAACRGIQEGVKTRWRDEVGRGGEREGMIEGG